MASLDEIRNGRIKKIELLKNAGMEIYPAYSKCDFTLAEAQSDFEKISKRGESASLVGRVMSLRPQGGLCFFNFFDGTATFQGLLKIEDIGEKMFSLFVDAIDIGDFVEVSGNLFITNRGEKTISVSDWKILSKSLLPLPEKWHGLIDIEERYRKRYLDILMDGELKEVFIKKALFWKAMRQFLETKGFIEVHTPTLEITTGGAEATPFKTHINDYDLDVYLRISVGELWQKRLMSAGFPRTYEIGRVYRNEGSSPEHLQEFTNMEFYASYLNFEDGKKMVQDLYKEIAQKVFGKTKFETRGHTYDLGGEWQDLDYVDTVEKITGVNVLEAKEKDLKKKLEELGVEYDGENRERMSDALWKYCRRQISGPAFLINHPKLVAPLSKEHPDDLRKTKTFQVIIAGSELGRAHAELNDPIDQELRFNEQKKLLEGGDTEAMMNDTEFVEMMEHGMPPTFGFGVGERLFAYMVDKPIRETTLFPLMRPR
ncbi:MAG: amino acid--tRNA ligase-related protein [Patescibacteria group bacterium]